MEIDQGNRPQLTTEASMNQVCFVLQYLLLHSSQYTLWLVLREIVQKVFDHEFMSQWAVPIQKWPKVTLLVKKRPKRPTLKILGTMKARYLLGWNFSTNLDFLEPLGPNSLGIVIIWCFKAIKATERPSKGQIRNFLLGNKKYLFYLLNTTLGVF